MFVTQFVYRKQLLLLEKLCNQLEEDFLFSDIIQLYDLPIAFVVPDR